MAQFLREPNIMAYREKIMSGHAICLENLGFPGIPRHLAASNRQYPLD
jgi:hypothetical protein